MKQQTKPTPTMTHIFNVSLNTGLKVLAVAVGMMMVTIPTSQADVAKNGVIRNVGDLEIYQQASGGNINLMMMLDTSGSMGISSLVLPNNNTYGSPGDVTSSLCARKSNSETGGNVSNPIFDEWAYNAKDASGKTAFKQTVTVNGQSIDYYLRGCSAASSTFPSIDASGNLLESDTGKFDRLSRMKQALISLILSDKIPSNVAIGLGNFSARTPLTIGGSSIKLVDGHSGTILVPAATLTPAQKEKLIRAIAQFKSVDNFTDENGTDNSNRKVSTTTPPDEYKASSGTPTAHAYAEAAAYMMGTTTGSQTQATSVSLVYDGYAILKDETYSPGTQTYWVCDTLGTGTTNGPGGTTVYQCDNNWPIIDNQSNKYVTDVGIDQDAQQTSRTTRVYDQNGVLQANYPASPITRNASNIWKIINEFPVGWRFGGWRKVANEPMDIEPVTGKAWTTPARGAGDISTGGYGLFAYRTSPFSLTTRTVSNPTTQTRKEWRYDNCPSGFKLDTNWPSLCYQDRPRQGAWVKDAGYSRSRGYYCDATVAPVKGSQPINNVYDFDRSANPRSNANPTGTITTDSANTNGSWWKLYNNYYCEQTRYYIARTARQVDVTVTNDNTTTELVDNLVGGFTYSSSDTKSGGNYIRGATPGTGASAQCDANGIYFLTDGAPNSTKPTMAQTIMNTSLTPVSGTATTRYAISSTPTTGLSSPAINSNLFPGETGGWEWIGEYAKRLNDATKNPSGVAIKTAVAGFGSSFAGLNYNTITSKYNCDTAGATQDAKNACKWGQKGEGYGEGGFFYTQSATDISNSVLKFIDGLNNTIPAAPSGTLTVPTDPYRLSGELPVAYVPSLQSQLSGDTNTSNIWPGNIKKYNLQDGTLYGQGKDSAGKFINAVFTDQNGNLNTNTRDLWQGTTDYQITNLKTGVDETHNEAVQAGGVYANLLTPSSSEQGATVATTRTVWIEDSTSPITTTNQAVTTTKLKQISVGTDGKPVGVDNINDQVTYTRANIIKLLRFMGFEQAKANATSIPQPLEAFVTTADNLKDLILVQPSTPTKVLGASVHSKPVAISYSAPLVNSRVSDTGRDDYVLFGSMDGGLHLVDADDKATNNAVGTSAEGGKEKFVIIPRVMMNNQADALVPNSKYTPNTTDTTKPIRPASVPYFGIDGSWITNSTYTFNYTDKKAQINSLYAYGGMRLGGKGLLGFNLKSNTTPLPGFDPTPDDTNNTDSFALIDNNTTGFDRLSYVWSQPSAVKVRTAANTVVDALVFGGGYDKCYENEYFQADSTDVANITDTSCKTTDGTKTKQLADGNAVYIINAKTGALLWSATYSTTAPTKTTGGNEDKFDGKKYMKNSIVGGITVLDRDADGIIDQLYFADLGGQLFRADFNGGIVGTTATNNTNGRIVRLLADNQAGTSLARRFYERPNVSFYNNGSTRFALINVISGDRSSPLSKLRSGTDEASIAANADRLYGIIDTDAPIAANTFYAAAFSPTIRNLGVDGSTTASGLTASIEKLGTIGTINPVTNQRITKTDLTDPLKDYTKRGWYYPLTRFDGYRNVQYSKGMGRSEVFGSKLITTVYNPTMNYSNANLCTAKIVGGSERETYCLPWGICDDATSIDGTGGYLRAGQGIQELNFGPQSAKQLDQRLMIGNLPLSELVSVANRANWGRDSNKTTYVPPTYAADGTVSTPAKAGLQSSEQVTSPTSSTSSTSPTNIMTSESAPGTTEVLIHTSKYALLPQLWYEQN